MQIQWNTSIIYIDPLTGEILTIQPDETYTVKTIDKTTEYEYHTKNIKAWKTIIKTCTKNNTGRQIEINF